MQKLILKIELVPNSVWFKSIRLAMPRSKWNKLRELIFARSGGRCKICNKRGKLHCHERWRYDDKKRIQRLVGFEAVCSNCHWIHHFALAEKISWQAGLNIGEIIRHFLKVNHTTMDVFNKHWDDAYNKWHDRSEFKWKTDFGRYKSYATLKRPNQALKLTVASWVR
jgi:hypothetical protein